MSSISIEPKNNHKLVQKKSNKFIVDNDSSDYNKGKGKKWTKEEDELLAIAVSTYEEKNWQQISEMMKNRSSIQCLNRWKKIVMPGIVKGPWTYSEDRKLLNWIKKEGPTKWSICASTIPGRSGKQCRERWFNALNPNVKKGDWTPEEEYAIYLLYSKHGGKWSSIALNFEHRTENSIKNRLYSSLRKKHSEWKKNEKEGGNVSTTNSRSKDKTILGTNDLVKYLPKAIEVTAAKLMKRYHYTKEEFKEYENSIIQKSFELLNSKKAKKIEANIKGEFLSSSDTITFNPEIKESKNDSMIDNIAENNDSISDNNLEDDLVILEREINQICQYSDILDEKITFNQAIEIQDLLQLNLGDCNLSSCDKDKGNDDVYGYLIEQLQDLESLVKETKKEILKYTNFCKDKDKSL